MNLIWHQFKTDFRHFRLWLVAWWMALALGVAGSHWGRGREALGEVFVLASFFQGLLAIFLIARVVQCDPLVDTTAFWLTRPVRRFHLAWSKSAFLVLFLFLPFMVMQSVIWIWDNGFSFELWLCAVAQFAPINGAILLAVGAMAAVTKNIRQFLLACVGALALFLLWMGLLFTLERIGWLRSAHSSGTVLENNKMAIMWLVLATGMLAAWIGQAFAGRRGWSLAVFTLALLLIVPIANYWRGATLLIRNHSVPWKQVRLTVLGEDDSLEDSPGSQILWSHFRVDGLGAHQMAAVTSLQGTFQTDQKNRLEFKSNPHEWGRWVLDQHGPDVFRLVQGYFPSNTLWFGSMQTRRDGSLPVVSKGSVAPGQAGHFSGSVRWSVVELRRLADFPLKEKTTATVMPGRQISLTDIKITMQGIEVKMVKSYPHLLYRPDEPPGGVYNYGSDCVYVLYHPDFGEAFPLTSLSGYYSGNDIGPGTAGGGVQFDFPFPALRARLTGITVQEWLSHARLLVFQPEKIPGYSQASFDQKDYVYKQNRSQEQAKGNRGTGLAAIRAAKLPAHPTAAEWRSYIQTLADNVFGNLDEAGFNLIQKKVAAIGPEGRSVLLGMLPLGESFEMRWVYSYLVKNVTREEIPELLKALPRDLSLARVFREKHWEADARETLAGLLPDHRISFPADALIIAASGKEPKTYPELAWHFVHGKENGVGLVQALEECPGFDLAEVVRQAWKLHQTGFPGDDSICLAAAAEGLPEALDDSIRKFKSYGGGSEAFKKRLVQLTQYRGADKDLQEWLEGHLGEFRYEAEAKRYRRWNEPGVCPDTVGGQSALRRSDPLDQVHLDTATGVRPSPGRSKVEWTSDSG